MFPPYGPKDSLGACVVRNISFSMTKEAFLNGTKDVTRRLGWKNLKAGDRLMAVEKSQGLKKGEKIKRLGPIEVVSVHCEALDTITKDDVVREGFPDLWPSQFIARFAFAQGILPGAVITRIEFRRVPS